MAKRKAVQFGAPPSRLWFAPQPAQAPNVKPAAAQEFPRLQKPEPAGGDEPVQAASQPTQAKES